MNYETKSYPLDCPSPVWEALREVQATNRNINDEIVRAIAVYVDRAEVSLPSEQQRVIETIVEEVETT